jgi:hypothetical protein
VRHRSSARSCHCARRERAHWRECFPALVALGLLLLAPALVRAQGAGQDSVTLRWTAVGDDSLSGTAAAYDLRMSDALITTSNWSVATALSGLPVPLASGTRQQVTIRGLTPGSTYYFALRVRDDAGNWSGISNLVRWDGVLDEAPPAAPGGLVSELQGNSVHLTWTPSSAPDIAGYSVYRATAAGGLYTKLNPDLLTAAEYQDDALPADPASLWYQVTATDMSFNESARSDNVPGESIPQSRTLAFTWGIEPAYPNPSRASDPNPVRIPVELVNAGTARVDIVDAAGHLVWRSADLQGLVVGDISGHPEVEWDGKNDAGRAVAPGPYRAWLIAGDVRRSIRLVRVP